MPPRVVGVAQPAGLDRPAAIAALAAVRAEDRVIEPEGKHVSAEPGPDRGQQLFQQACRLPGRLPRAHRQSSARSKTVAVTLTGTPLRAPRACR
jgi:hypothetical protein